jgi:hypothetical protein
MSPVKVWPGGCWINCQIANPSKARGLNRLAREPMQLLVAFSHGAGFQCASRILL